MERKAFINRIQRLHPMQALFLTFNKQDLIGATRLLAIIGSDARIRVEKSDEIVLLAIERSQDWSGDRNRTIAVHGLVHANIALLEEMAKTIEKLSVGDHGAKALFTTRTKTFEEASATITRAVITDDLRREIEGWGLNVYSDPRMQLMDSLPGIEFSIRDSENNTLLAIQLDGWSGRMAINGKFGDTCYTQPSQIQSLIRENLESCLEKMTVAV